MFWPRRGGDLLETRVCFAFPWAVGMLLSLWPFEVRARPASPRVVPRWHSTKGLACAVALRGPGLLCSPQVVCDWCHLLPFEAGNAVALLCRGLFEVRACVAAPSMFVISIASPCAVALRGLGSHCGPQGGTRVSPSRMKPVPWPCEVRLRIAAPRFNSCRQKPGRVTGSGIPCQTEEVCSRPCRGLARSGFALRPPGGHGPEASAKGLSSIYGRFP